MSPLEGDNKTESKNQAKETGEQSMDEAETSNRTDPNEIQTAEENATVPDVYVAFMSPHERVREYTEEILPKVRCSRVEDAILTYVAVNLEPAGWEAVWRCSKIGTDIDTELDLLVEVIDVSQEKLEAEVKVKKSVSTVPAHKQQAIESFLQQDFSAVSLLHLYPVFDPNNFGMFDKTAQILEHVRFFYEHLWRPWDADEDDDPVFVKRHLHNRMKLYQDLSSGTIPRTTAQRIQNILKEAKEKYQQIEDLQTQMQVSDSEADLNEEDVMKCMKLNLSQEQLLQELNFLENPLFRTLINSQGLPQKPCPRGQRAGSNVVTHLLANNILTIDMIMVCIFSSNCGFVQSVPESNVWHSFPVHILLNVWLDLENLP